MTKFVGFTLAVLVLAASVLIFALSVRVNQKLLRDYQIDVHKDTVKLYDKERLVGIVVDSSATKLNNLIIEDNR